MPAPRVGDGVWVSGVKPQPNGKIEYIDYESGEAIVRFYDSNDTESYELDVFDFYSGSLKQWIIEG